MPVYVSKTTAFVTDSTMLTNWKAKTTAALEAKRKYDFGVKSLAYLTDEYQVKATTGKKTIWDALNSTYTTANGLIAGLKSTADALGMNTATDFTRNNSVGVSIT